MNISNAHALLTQAARLIELTATFEARYGRHYTLKPGSPDEAWTLYHTIFDLQCVIARLLDAAQIMDDTQIDELQHRHGRWWEHHDAIDTKTAEAIACAASHLIACTANFAVQQSTTEDWSYAMQNTQLVIAGLLHPAALRVAADEQVELSVS